MTVSAELRKSLEDIELFTGLVRSQVDRPEVEFERLLDGYLEARRSLARQFCLVAQRHLLRGDNLLEHTRKRIERRMTELYANQIPDKYRVVHGYSSVQPIILQYLAQHVGNPVRSSKLRVLTADQIHTERRVRDLRDLGFDVEWKKVSDDDQYVLVSVEPNVDAAAALLLRKNIKDDKKLAKPEKDRLLTVVDSPADA
ncbi:MAG: hypothetical protein ACLQG3_07885 [Terracidiphilus sp.]